MNLLKTRYFIMISLLIAVSSCQEAKLNQSSAPGGADRSCIEGDKIKLDLPANIQECFDQGNIFHFESKTCITANKASFECRFDAMAARVSEIGISSSTILAAKEQGAYLVSCSEKSSGNTVIAQWYVPASKADLCSDENPISQVVTACYKLYAPGQTPPLETKEQQSQALLGCLQE